MELSEWVEGIIPEASETPLQVAAATHTPKVTAKFADSPFTAPGWRDLGCEYSCVPDAEYPWDPQIMREIRRWAPDAVPMWVRWAFLSPRDKGETRVQVLGRHALGRHIENLTMERHDFRCHMPAMPCQGLYFKQPNRLWFIHQGEMSRDRNAALLGAYLPFDWGLLNKVIETSIDFRQTEKEFIEAEKERMIAKRIAHRELMRSQFEDNMEYADRDFGAYKRKQLDKVSELEIIDHVRGRGRREQPRKIQVGYRGPTPR